VTSVFLFAMLGCLSCIITDRSLFFVCGFWRARWGVSCHDMSCASLGPSWFLDDHDGSHDAGLCCSIEDLPLHLEHP